MDGTEAPLSSAAPANPASEPGTEDATPESGRPPGGRSRWTTIALVAAFLVLLFLAIFLPPLINLGHYRRSITASMSLALGRPVYVGGMQLRLLPLPGIAMTDFTVEEDPSFGYEPALHANSVVAYLRFSSLWRGRLEVSRISLDEASLNLVRNQAGQWNIGSILLRASQIPNAPTGERHAGRNLRFPYIEATDSRINFKQGVEKKPFSLMNADFSMWQASGNQWGLRLKAQPVRTDLELHLSDTGSLSVEGSLERAPALDSMPVDLDAEWSGAQLGQVSRLLAGSDSGWRGGLDATASLRGTLGNLAVRSRLRVANLRRLEFQPVNTVDVDATCQGAYHHTEHSITGVTCFWPVSAGHLLLTADTLNVAPPRGDLHLEINRIPAQFPVTLLGLIRPRVDSLSATGTLNGDFDWTTKPQPVLTGHAEATGITLSSGSHSISLPAMHFVAATVPSAVHSGKHRAPAPQIPNSVSLQPVSIPFGAPQPLVVDAQVTRSGFALHFTGQASLDRLTSAGTDFGLLGNSLAALTGKGRVEINTTTSSNWMAALANPAPAPATTGSIRLQNAQIHPAFLHSPVTIESADLFLSPQQISWQNAAFRYQHLALRGSLDFPAACNQSQPCPASFSLQSPTLDAGALEAALLARPQSGILGQFFSDALGSSEPTPWPLLHGSVAAATLQLGRLPLHNATAMVSIDGTALTIHSLDGSTLGGAFHASGGMNLNAGLPAWSITAQISGAQATQAGALFHERWGTGVLTGAVRLTASGFHLPDLISTAAGDFRATWQKGGMAVASGVPLNRFDRWTASGSVANRTLTLATGSVTRNGNTNSVRGTITFDRRIDLTVDTRKGPVRIGGALAQPPAAAQP